ncbi:MAG: sigma-54-dependent Fis family transcriptional regulator [Planctomycetes bacterium]|nr:sigma-54-dependent Fis family transcriptional regulator [Planctomycetota bacterium]
MSDTAAEPAKGPMRRILAIEDDASYGLLLRYQLQREGYEPAVVTSGEEGLRRLQELEPSVVLLDVMLPGKDGRQILDEIHRIHPELPVVMITAAGSVEMAVECMKRGAYDFLTKPFEFERLYAILRNAIEYHELKKQLKQLEGALIQRHDFEQIVGVSERMRRVVDQAKRAAASDSDVLILGESGTGKEVLARAVHYNSARRKGPFVAINCGAIPEGLLESELFGHEKGAFTGAVARRIGCFEQAEGGTLFLDEIGEMRPDMQVRLLRALEQREVRRVGSDKTIKVNVRVLSATNQNLTRRIKEAKFRTDLYYRLAILVLEIPALRERPEDIAPLAQHFLALAHREGHTRATEFAPDALEVLKRYEWPGNARELRNAIERAVVFEDSGMIQVASLPPELVRRVALAASGAAAPAPEPRAAEGGMYASAAAGAPPRPLTPSRMSTPSILAAVSAAAASSAQTAAPKAAPAEARDDGEIMTMEDEEKKIILRALALTDGNISESARRLGLHRSTLHRKMARYGLATEEDLEASENES